MSSLSSFLLNGKSTVVRGSCPTYTLDGPVYGERSVFCSVRAVAHQRGEEDHGHKHGHGRHEKDARRETKNTPPVCCCEPIAPLDRELRGHLNLPILN